MIKKISFILVLWIITTACSDQADDNKSTENQEAIPTTGQLTTEPSTENGEEVELSENDILAMDILNDEIFLDYCNAYAIEDKVEKNDLKTYLSDCTKQLKLEASIIIDPSAEESKAVTTEKTVPKE